MINPKPQSEHQLYLAALHRMTPEQRLTRAFELSAIAKELAFTELRKKYPKKNHSEIIALYLIQSSKTEKYQVR